MNREVELHNQGPIYYSKLLGEIQLGGPIAIDPAVGRRKELALQNCQNVLEKASYSAIDIGNFVGSMTRLLGGRLFPDNLSSNFLTDVRVNTSIHLRLILESGNITIDAFKENSGGAGESVNFRAKDTPFIRFHQGDDEEVGAVRGSYFLGPREPINLSTLSDNPLTFAQMRSVLQKIYDVYQSQDAPTPKGQ